MDNLIARLEDVTEDSRKDREENKLIINFANAALIVTKVLSHRRKTLTKKQRHKIKQSAEYLQKLSEYEERAMKLAPQCEDRVICIRDKEVSALLKCHLLFET
jgi:16S rRNA A1518/A1519 N6-dimethyltransferase RsmA/KsgA/DIM1 with predicted DNA glycosylase/AP lyase activity